MTSEEDLGAWLAATLEDLGPVDVFVNNASVLGPRVAIEAYPADAWRQVIEVNLTGAFLCAKHAAAHLRSAHGAIVNIASTRALQSERDTEAYSASKGGIVALTHALAISLGPEIRVNCISPGWIDVSAWKKRSAARRTTLRDADHQQHPAGRVGTPEDIAGLVAYLASPDAAFITGANLVVDGGMTRKMIYV